MQNITLFQFFRYTIMMSYFIQAKYPLESYLEYPLLVIQDFTILIMALSYQKKMGISFLVICGLYSGLSSAIITNFFSKSMISFFVVSI